MLGLSIIQTRPSSFKASLMSLILILSRALLENLRSFIFSGSSSSSLPTLPTLAAELAAFFLFPPPFPPLLEEVTRAEEGERGAKDWTEPGPDISSAFLFLPPAWLIRGGGAAW